MNFNPGRIYEAPQFQNPLADLQTNVAGLAQVAEQQIEQQNQIVATLSTLRALVGALVETHPDPQALREAFQKAADSVQADLPPSGKEAFAESANALLQQLQQATGDQGQKPT